MSHYKFYMLNQDPRKREFVAFRLETNKLTELKEEASQKNLDLSSLIRMKLGK